MENFVLNGNGQIDINRKGELVTSQNDSQTDDSVTRTTFHNPRHHSLHRGETKTAIANKTDFQMDTGYKFRLQEINHNTEICSTKDACDDTATSVSSYSNYKQRIDAMFDDSKSVLSDMSKSDKKRKSLLNQRETRSETGKERVTSNKIQEKIEKMFEEISVNGQQQNDVGANGLQQNGQQKAGMSSRHDFSVTYLGSKPLPDKNVSLMSLQEPLKQLYFEYKRHPPGDQANILTISKEGLKIKVSDKEELNPFPTIAVWASVKLSFRVTPTATEFAFLPLITDPDGIDKNLLFRELKAEDKDIFQGNINDDNQSPILTVVMKNVGKNKQLECHGFVCKSSEEAIVIAANLYQALMKKLKRKKEHKTAKADKDSAVEVLQTEENRIKPKVKVKKPAPPVPPRSPKNPEQEKCSTPTLEGTAKTEESSEKKLEQVGKPPQRRGSVPNTATEPVRTLRRTVSERGGNGITVKSQTEGGDILTKVAIPRSRSFLNANGPLTRYSGRSKANPKNEVVSPLGFKEMFNEFRIHEGLESMDDILNAIIDAEGMSFNDLKPIYKEFLLKLAVTLTKDELYQRSKIIMRRQKKRNKNCSFRKKACISSMGLHKIFRKTATKLGKTKTQRPTNLEFTSIVFQSSTKQFESNLPNIKKRKPSSLRVKRRQSSRRRLAKRLEKAKSKHVSTTSEDSDFFQPKRNTSDSGGGPNRSSSGYFSCSECSCDSENCTCTRNDKCYCSLGHKKSYGASSSDESRFLPSNKSSFRPEPTTTSENEAEDSLKSCSCDTDSCVDSSKCYCTQKGKRMYNNKIMHLSDMKGVCQTPHLHQKEKLHNGTCPNYIKQSCGKHGENIIGQMKEHGFASSGSVLSRAASPATAWQSNERHMRQKTHVRRNSSLDLLDSRPKSHSVDCRRYPGFEEHLLKEIQNTSFRGSFCNGVQHSCFHVTDDRSVCSPRFPNGSREYSSMRCRREIFNEDFPLHRSVSYSKKNFFSSLRSKHSCDSIMNHIKFPNNANSSLRFTQRMDVYNSFSENRPRFRGSDLICHSHFKENRRLGLPSNCADTFHLRRGNLQRLDYNLFTFPKSDTPDSQVHKKKVLVVSARDPKGKVLYMGTSSRCENLKNLKNISDNSRTASEALAVKKSAEIAALFSDVTSKQKPNHLDYAKDPKQSNYRARSNSYRSTNLENTLGYLP